MPEQTLVLSVSDFIASVNQNLEYAYTFTALEGEVASFKVNQGKYVFFDLKDDDATIACFMMVWQLRSPLADGMRIVINGTPKVTQWGKFSMTVQTITLRGEGTLRKSFDLLREKLQKEGLFAIERKRVLPHMPEHIGVISSPAAAGYADFIKILSERWGGVRITVLPVQVQGQGSSDQIIHALRRANEMAHAPEVLVILRGGGSADDLAGFNDELLVREIAASRIPVMTAIGHETDETLADLAADVRAATPTNAAGLLVPDRQEILRLLTQRLQSLAMLWQHEATSLYGQQQARLKHMLDAYAEQLAGTERRTHETCRMLQAFNPQAVLERGYALVRGKQEVGNTIEIETVAHILRAEVRHVGKK